MTEMLMSSTGAYIVDLLPWRWSDDSGENIKMPKYSYMISAL